MQKCYKCNIQFKDEKVRFCPYCGSPLAIDKEWQAEQDRKEKEYQEEQRRIEEWKQKSIPIISRALNAYNPLRELIKDKTFPYKLFSTREGYPMFSENVAYGNEAQLKTLEETAVLFEDLYGAAYNQGDTQRVNRLLDFIKSKLDSFESNVAKYEAYSCKSADLLSFVKKFLTGGVLELETETYTRQTSRFDLGIEILNDSHPLIETVSYQSISYSDREKYRIQPPENANPGWRFTYHRFPIYEEKTHFIVHFNFSAYGIKGKIKNISYSTPDWGKKLLAIYSDLNVLDFWLSGFVQNYSAPSKEFKKDELETLRLFSVERKKEAKKEPRKIIGYEYYFWRVRDR